MTSLQFSVPIETRAGWHSATECYIGVRVPYPKLLSGYMAGS
jgi:hypothetical protein